jgi:DNA replication initiation complex subunit (GINS family)
MMEENATDVDFSDLADIYSQEKGSNAISRLPDEFYRRAVTFIKTTFTRIENARMDIKQAPDKESVRATGEYQRSREILESIYNTRERKIVLAALNASRGIEQKTENMTEDEKDLFFNLKVELENKRDRVIRYDRLLSRPAVIRP